MRRGFSLIELAIVLVFAGLISGLVLHIRQNNVVSAAGDCNATTKVQLADIQAAMDRFVRSNDRYPLPAKRALGVENPDFGREVAAGTDPILDASSTIITGALPFQTLGLSPSFAGDCWGNKLTYVVTKTLTDATTFSNPANIGQIVINNQLANKVADNMAYAIISHGADGLGASKLNGTDAGYCTLVAGRLQTENCDYNNTVLMLAPFNEGADAGNSFFDDMIVYAGKAGTLGAGSTPNNGQGFGTNNKCQLAKTGPCGGSSTLPVDIGGTIGFKQIVSGDWHSCGLSDAGVAYCWGNNTTGQVGNGATSPTPLLVPTLVSGGFVFNKLAAGRLHSCGIAVSGTLYCWGEGSVGQIGDGGTSYRTVPTPVSIAMTFTDVTSFALHTCAIGTDAKTYCWGENNFGQVGSGVTGGSVLSPVALQPAHTTQLFTDIGTGHKHTCAINAAGIPYCWGANDVGQLGNKSLPTVPVTDDSNVPTLSLKVVEKLALLDPTTEGNSFIKITAGGMHSCGLTTGGKIICWGDNSAGQLGGVSTGDPVLVTGSERYVNVAAGHRHTCAIGDTGEVRCWGNNTFGQLGDGTIVDNPAPQLVTGTGTTIIANDVATGWNTTFLIVTRPTQLPPAALPPIPDCKNGKCGYPTVPPSPVDTTCLTPCAPGVNECIGVPSQSSTGGFACNTNAAAVAVCTPFAPLPAPPPTADKMCPAFTNVPPTPTWFMGSPTNGGPCYGGQPSCASLSAVVGSSCAFTGQWCYNGASCATATSAFECRVTPPPPPPPPLTCPLPWGGTIANGASVTAYSTMHGSTVAVCETAGISKETRTCAAGVLSGSFTYPTMAGVWTWNGTNWDTLTATCAMPSFSGSAVGEQQYCCGDTGAPPPPFDCPSEGLNNGEGNLTAGPGCTLTSCCSGSVIVTSPGICPVVGYTAGAGSCAPPPVVNGACGAASNTCTSAPAPTSFVAGGCGGNDTWTCPGSGGGSDASCSVAAPPTACDCSDSCGNSRSDGSTWCDVDGVGVPYLFQCISGVGGPLTFTPACTVATVCS